MTSIQANVVLKKTFFRFQGYQSVQGDEMTWMEGTFAGGAKNLTRIILRVADPAVDMIQVDNISLIRLVCAA